MRIEKINNLKIYDDVLDKQFLDYINDSIFSMKWMLNADKPESKTPLFFSSMTVDEDVSKEEFIFLFNIIYRLIKNEPGIKGKYISLERGYVNLYPYGIGGDWHIDSDSTNGRTILFYPSDWKKEYGGATEFQTGEKVEYKKNRLLIFDASLSHRSAVHHNPHNRYVVAYKTEIE